MDRGRIPARLRDRAPELRRRGIVRAALFGSVARGEARPDSDILAGLDPEVVRTLFDDAGVKNAIGDLFAAEVDVVDRAGAKTGCPRSSRPSTPKSRGATWPVLEARTGTTPRMSRNGSSGARSRKHAPRLRAVASDALPPMP